MISIPLGKITATPGTPTQLPAAANGQRVCAIMIAQIAGTTGNVYFGKFSAGIQRAGGSPALQGVIREFQPPATSGFLDSEVIGGWEENNLDPTEFGVDNDNASQGMLVTLFQL